MKVVNAKVDGDEDNEKVDNTYKSYSWRFKVLGIIHTGSN
jgi:hypothetical protein